MVPRLNEHFDYEFVELSGQIIFFWTGHIFTGILLPPFSVGIHLGAQKRSQGRK